MNIKDAIESWERAKLENLPEYLKLTGIKVNDDFLTNEILESNDFGISFDNSKPSFVSLVGTMINNMKGNRTPVLISVKKNNK